MSFEGYDGSIERKHLKGWWRYADIVLGVLLGILGILILIIAMGWID